ncbi:MAG: hypothetical protein IJX05_04120, partial [Clostridia bacterium]|nr:hypothetical protein [Clostridia bacterium]
EFIAEGCVCRTTKRPSGRGTFCYEIRYRRNGYNVSASSTDPVEAKRKFIEMLKEAISENQVKKSASKNFCFIAEEWFSIYKKKIAVRTYKNYYSYYSRYIKPILEKDDIDKIRSSKLVEVMKQVEGKGRAYEDIRGILNQIFKYAIINGDLTNNPVQFVEFIKAERETRSALSRNEVQYLLLRLKEPRFDKFRSAYYLQLFCGLRPCEVATAKVEGDFIVVRNAKRKKGKIEYKKIPIPEEAQNLDLSPSRSGTTYLNEVFKLIFPAKTQYELRHTFSTVCQQYVRREIVEIWLGDSPERLIGRTYTHFDDDFMHSEMQKVVFVPQNVPQT